MSSTTTTQWRALRRASVATESRWPRLPSPVLRAGPSPPHRRQRVVEVAYETSPSDDAGPLTPGEALCELFLHNADRGFNADNDELVAELQRRVRALSRPPDVP